MLRELWGTEDRIGVRIPGCQNCTLVGTRKIQLNTFVGSGNMYIAHVGAPLVPGMGFRASGMQGKHCPYELYHVNPRRWSLALCSDALTSSISCHWVSSFVCLPILTPGLINEG